MSDFPEVETQPKIKLDPKLLQESKAQVEAESQVVIHVTLTISELPSLIRIWSNTYLICGNSSAKSKLLNADKISFAPLWTRVDQEHYQFTLIFEGLARDCVVFDLVEDIPTMDRFEYFGIARNQSDIYHLNLIP